MNNFYCPRCPSVIGQADQHCKSCGSRICAGYFGSQASLSQGTVLDFNVSMSPPLLDLDWPAARGVRGESLGGLIVAVKKFWISLVSPQGLNNQIN